MRGEIFRTRPDWPWGPTSLLYNGYRVSFSGIKWPRRGVDHPPHLASRLKKVYSYNLLPLWAFVACCRVNSTFLTFTFTWLHSKCIRGLRTESLERGRWSQQNLPKRPLISPLWRTSDPIRFESLATPLR